MTIIDEIKQRVKIEDLVATMYTVVGQGRVRTTKEHDSLKLWVEQGTWYWFSRGLGGDVLDWYALVHRCDLRTAVHELARVAGVELRPLTEAEQEERTAAQRRAQVLTLAADHYHRTLMQHPGAQAARAWCAQRGWTADTLRREMVGYVLAPGDMAPVTAVSPVDKNGLSTDELPPLAKRLQAAGLGDEPLAKAVLSIPAGMIVYAHREAGQVRYLAGRSVEGKRHYNLPEEFSGGKVAYCNEPAAGRRGGVRLLVEGQADAIALGQLGFDAVALCGLHAPGVDRISHVALDNDGAGQKRAVQIALGLGPLTPVVTWPHTFGGQKVKDAADVVRLGPTAKLTSEQLVEVVEDWLDEAPPALVARAEMVKNARGDDRQEVIRQVVDAFLDLDDITATDLKPALARAMKVNIQQFNRLVAARNKETEGDGEKENPLRYEYSSGGAKVGHLWEQCLTRNADGVAQVQFAVRLPTGKIETRPSITLNDVCYIPYPLHLGLVEKEVVLFPQQPVEYTDQKGLVREIQQFIHDYVDIDQFYERLAAYYVLFSWIYDLFEDLPYLRALGDYGTGKTRFIMTIGACCYRPMFVSGASTVSPIFNLLEMFNGTLIIDEADFSNSDAEAEIIKILNVGYYRKGVVLRSEKDPSGKDKYWPAVKSVYGPKILATRRLFTDRATESRCLTKRMTTARPRPGIPYNIPPEFWSRAQELRNKLLMYRLRNHRPVTIDSALADVTVEPRLNQVTMALKSIVDNPEMREDIDLFIRAYNDTLVSDRQMSLPALVLQAVLEIFYTTKINILGEDERDLSLKSIAAKTQDLLNDIDPDTKISPKKVGKVLSEELGLSRRETHARHRRAVLVFDESELEALMRRYGLEKPLQQK